MFLTEPEVISNSPVFIIAVFAIILMIIGFKSNRRIFNLFSIPAFIYLAVYFNDSTALIIMFVALIIYNIYYAFIGAYE